MEKRNVRIAVVGTGIAGLATAWLLNRRHAVTVFEAETRVGGHSHTVQVRAGEHDIPVDTGFMVYNEYPCPLLAQFSAYFGIRTEATTLSFSASIADVLL